MQDINSVILTGRMTKDIDIKYTTSGTPVGSFSIACNKSRKVNNEWKEEAHFFDIVVFSHTAVFLTKHGCKGKEITISGELDLSRWTDDKGQSHSKVKIIAKEIKLVFTGTGEKKEIKQDNGSIPDPWKDEQIPF
jgi:single-strand DNA-binding protein